MDTNFPEEPASADHPDTPPESTLPEAEVPLQTPFDAEEPAEPAAPIEAAAEPASEEPSAAEPEEEFVAEGEASVPADEDAQAGADELTQLAEASQRARLSPSEEERMTALLKEALLGGRGGVARAVEALPKVPWIVGVRAIEQVWPELTAGFRTQLLAGLGKDETDAARRMRLSVARALFKVDAPVTLKVAVAVAREMRDKDSGALAPKHAQIFSNVFIGRAKPWVAQLTLGELKPAEADVLVHCAVMSVFTIPHPPVTQLGVLKWTQENDRLEKLQPEALEAIKKGVARWSGKWQGALRREVASLPEEIVAVLKPARGENGGAPEAEAASAPVDGEEPGAEGEREETPDENTEDRAEGEPTDEDAPPPRKERPVYEPRPQKPSQPQEPRREREGRERPVYEPRNAGSSSSRFDLSATLRQIEQHVQGLRNELAAAKTRSRDDEKRSRRSEKTGPIIEGEPTPEELARLNLQLEARNVELQTQIDELKQHSEDLALSTGAMAGVPVEDTGAQLRTLLALKLQEDYADFLALQTESNDLVVQQHYRSLIGHIFEVLQQLDVPLKAESEQ
jgi:hypothetical protein